MSSQVSKGQVVLTCGGFRIMGFLLHPWILYIIVPQLDLFVRLKLSCLRFQRVSSQCQGSGRVFNPSPCFQIT